MCVYVCGGGEGLVAYKAPFLSKCRMFFFSADDWPMVSTLLNQKWLCSVSSSFEIIGL